MEDHACLSRDATHAAGSALFEFPAWPADRARVCRRIRQQRARLKIVLKTRNERQFIARWIGHHAAIVGEPNLVVFDNGSDDPEVLDVYRRHPDVTVVRFSDHPINLHHSGLYRDLYRALAEASDYVLFLDTDEFLVRIAQDRVFADGSVLRLIEEHPGVGLFPCTWLFNAAGSATRFSCGDLAANMAFGKPLIRTAVMPIGHVNHTFQLGARLLVPPIRTDLFLLHLRNEIPQQRIATNLNKLIAAGLARPDHSAASVAARGDIADPLAARYVEEIRASLRQQGAGPAAGGPLAEDCFEIAPDGAICYAGDRERAILNEFIADPARALAALPARHRIPDVAGAGISPTGAPFGQVYF
jgi:hypothetical protein